MVGPQKPQSKTKDIQTKSVGKGTARKKESRQQMPETTCSLKVTHRIVYNTSKAVPLGEMIISLQGLQGILKSFPTALSGATGVQVEGCEFLIQNIESGSLIEDVVIKILFKDRARMDAFLEKAGENGMVKTAVIGALIGGLVIYGMQLATSSNPAPNITANNNTVINIGAGEVKMTPEEFTAVVRAAVGDKKAAAESALRFIAPAKADPGSNVSLADGEVLINSAAVAETPSKIELAANERLEQYKNVELVIRAANLDSKKSGWAGRLGGREDRLPIELDPTVSENDVFGKSSVRVDAAVVFTEKGRSRELKATKIYVHRVLP